MEKVFGTWFTYSKPKWEKEFDYYCDEIVRETGLSREKLKQVLECLSEHRIID